MVRKLTINESSQREAENQLAARPSDFDFPDRVRDFFPGLHSSYHKLVIEAAENGTFSALNLPALKSYYDHFARFADKQYGYKEFASDRFEDILASVSLMSKDGVLVSEAAIKADAENLCVNEAEDCNRSLRSELGY